jgi:uncharacterized OB-fold protein
MIEPIVKPRRKNPLQRTRLPTSPPRARSRARTVLRGPPPKGRFMLQRCGACGTFCYPARTRVRRAFLPISLCGRTAARHALSETTLHVPADVHFRERAPWRVGLVAMECGPKLVTHLHADCEEGRPVVMSFQLDKSGQAVAFAHPERETPNMADDRQWREMTADPKFRRVLVTNGRASSVRKWWPR